MAGQGEATHATRPQRTGTSNSALMSADRRVSELNWRAIVLGGNQWRACCAARLVWTLGAA